MIDYTLTSAAQESLAKISSSRYPPTPTFHGADHLGTPSTISLIELCDTLTYMCKSRPHYLPTDLRALHKELHTTILSLKHSFDKLMDEEEKALAADTKLSHTTTRVTKVPMGFSGKPSNLDKQIADLENEIARRKALKSERQENSTEEN